MPRLRKIRANLFLLFGLVIFTFSGFLHTCTDEHEDSLHSATLFRTGDHGDSFELPHHSRSHHHNCECCPVCNGTLLAEQTSPAIWTIRPEPGAFHANPLRLHSFIGGIARQARAPPVRSFML